MVDTSGWRDEVVLRDKGRCMAPIIDKDAGQCYDKWGEVLVVRDAALDLEADYIRFASVGGRHQFARDHVLLCPGHHRGTGPNGGQQWATAHRWELRKYLDE